MQTVLSSTLDSNQLTTDTSERRLLVKYNGRIIGACAHPTTGGSANLTFICSFMRLYQYCASKELGFFSPLAKSVASSLRFGNP